MSHCNLCGGEILDRGDARYCTHCNSTFHSSCIVDHFYRNKFCPVCNKTMSLIFMRYGEPPQPSSKKRAMPTEIRKPVWPQMERREEIPVIEMDIPRGPLKRRDKYIPKSSERRKLLSMPKKPVRLIAVIVLVAIIIVGVKYRSLIPSLPSLPGGESEPESPWKVVWSYSLEGVTDIATSSSGIAVGAQSGLYVLDMDGNILWQKEGEVTDVDTKGEVVVALNRNVVEIYTLQGEEVAQYSEGTCSSISLSEYGTVAVGLLEGGVVLLDIYGALIQQYETGPVGSVSLSADSSVTAYREGGKVYVVGVLGDVLYAFEDSGAGSDRIVLTSEGVFAQAQNEVLFYNGEDVVWSYAIEGCSSAGLAVSGDETQFAVNGGKAVVYSADGQELFTLPKGSCGGIAFAGADVVISDAASVFYLKLEEVPESEVPQTEPPEEGEKEGEKEEGEKQPGTYEEWFAWYESFLSEPKNSAVYNAYLEEEGKISQTMRIEFTIEGKEGSNTIETITMIMKSGETELRTTMKRWISPEGKCVKAEMTIDEKTDSSKCNETTVWGVDLREILQYKGQFEYLGQEEITVEKGTFLCHKLQINTEKGVLTLWVADDLPPVRISLQDGRTIATFELV